MKAVLYCTLGLLLLATAVPGQTSVPACDGDIAVVRVSEVKPGGIEAFLSAVAAQKAWYRANGIEDNEIFAARVLVRDEATRGMKYTDTEVLTYHVRPPSMERIPKRGDPAWNAYVKQFRDVSDIKSQYTVCIPKPAHPARP